MKVKSCVVRVKFLIFFAMGICDLGAYATQTADAVVEVSNLGEVRAQMLEFKDAAIGLFEFAFGLGNNHEVPQAAPESKAVAETKTGLVAMPSPSQPLATQKQKTYENELLLLDKLNEKVKSAKHQGMFKNNHVADINFDILAQTLEESLENLKRGRVALSQDLLRASFHTCLTCHSSGLTNQKFSFGDTAAIAGRIKSALSRARMYFVFREFDKVELETESVFDASSHVKQSNQSSTIVVPTPSEKRELLELFVASQLLQENPPKLVASKLQSFTKSVPADTTLADDLKEWIKDLMDWDKEESKQKKKVIRTPQLSRVDKWVGLEKGENLLITDSKLIPHLRAKQALTKLANSKNLTSDQQAKILHLLGLIYQAHDNTLFLGLGESYFISCIKKHKQTLNAEICYKSMAASVELASTGSSGMNLAPEDVDLLKKLKAEAYRSPK